MNTPPGGVAHLRRRVVGHRVAGVSVFQLVGPSLLSSHDARHESEISCTVKHAGGGAAPAPSAKGIGSSVPQMVFTTNEGRTLILQRGVDRASSARIAVRVEPDAVSVFTAGQGSIALRGALDFIGASPTVFRVREARRHVRGQRVVVRGWRVFSMLCFGSPGDRSGHRHRRPPTTLAPVARGGTITAAGELRAVRGTSGNVTGQSVLTTHERLT